MKKLIFLTLVLPLLCLNGSLKGQSDTIRATVYFETGKEVLTQEARLILDTLLSKPWDNAELTILLEGHADYRGSDRYNLDLSKRRVVQVRDYLIDLGVDTAQIHTAYYGERRPVSTHSDETNLLFNRRVGITLIISGEDPNLPISTIFELYRQLATESQSFTITAGKTHVISTSGGGVLYVRPNSFSRNGKPLAGEEVQLEVVESYSFGSMMRNHLSTTSNGELLSTAGMVYLDATSDGEPVEVNEGVTFFVPTSTVDSQLLFSGERIRYDSIMNWEVQEEGIAYFSNDQLRFLSSFPGSRFGAGPQSDGICPCDFFFCRIGRLPKATAALLSSSLKREVKLERLQIRLCNLADRYWKENDKENPNPSKLDKLLAKRWKTDEAYVRLYCEAEGIDITFLEVFPDSWTWRQRLDAYENNYAALMQAMQVAGVSGEDIKEVAEILVSGTWKERQERLQALVSDSISASYTRGALDKGRLGYYLFEMQGLGWTNIDVFTKINPKLLVDAAVEIPKDNTVDVRIIFPRYSVVMPPTDADETAHYFRNVPKNTPAFIITLQYKNKIPAMDIQRITMAEGTYPVALKEYDLEEMKQQLTVLD